MIPSRFSPFCCAALLVLASLIAPALAQRVRVMGANISSGNNQSYDLGHGTRIFQGIDPDVVLIQEFDFGSKTPTAIRGFVDEAFGPSFQYFREGGAEIPNGVISRYPILASGEWADTLVSNRDFAWARIDIPGPKDLWAVSVHLLTRSSGVRNSEAALLTNFVKANVPAGDYLVIGGDFNSDSRTEAQFTTFSQVVYTGTPHPADRNGNQNTNASRAKPYDSVFANDAFRALQVPVVIGGSTFADGLVVDTRVYSPIGDIAPALATDSGASQMQHMAIVKDFLIPLAADPAVIPVLGVEHDPAAPSLRISWQATPGAVYQVQAGANAKTWTLLGEVTAGSAAPWVKVVPANAGAGEVRDPLLSTAGRRFYRILRK